MSVIYFEIKVKYETFNDEGKTVKKSELYVLNAETFASAEERIIREVKNDSIFNLEVQSIKKTNYLEVHTDSETDSMLLIVPWFKCQVNTVLIDGETGKQSIDKHFRLVQAETTDKALLRTHELEKNSVLDYEIPSVSETKVVDVVLFKEKDEPILGKYEVDEDEDEELFK